MTKAASAAEQYGQFFYTGGKRGSFFTYSGLPAGDYEARAYFNWPDGGSTIRAATRFAGTRPFPGGRIRQRPRHPQGIRREATTLKGVNG